MDPLDIIKKYYDTGSELYYILVKHSQDVANRALEVCHKHKDLNADEEFVYEAAMLHDIGIYMTNARGIECYGKEPYILHGYLGAELLRKEFLPLHALVAERHTGTGLTPELIKKRKIPLPPGIYVPQSIEEQIICYADKFYSKSKLYRVRTAEEVMKSLQKHGDETVFRFKQMDERFG